jgi:hypothetical protein
LSDDQDAYVVKGLLEGAEYVGAGWQVGAAGCQFGAEELAHRGDAIGHWFECLRPAGLDEFM